MESGEWGMQFGFHKFRFLSENCLRREEEKWGLRVVGRPEGGTRCSPAMAGEACANRRQGKWRGVGMDHRPSAFTPFLLMSIPSLLKQQSDRSGSEPSSEASGSIACTTYQPSRTPSTPAPRCSASAGHDNFDGEEKGLEKNQALILGVPIMSFRSVTVLKHRYRIVRVAARPPG